jgi:hypothetical protein
MTIWYLISTASAIVSLGWNIAYMTRGIGFVHDVADWIFQEFRPFYLPAAVLGHSVQIFVEHKHLTWWQMVVIGFSVFNYVVSRDDHDDRWKRRRKRAAERVANLGGKLTVVPAGVSER